MLLFSIFSFLACSDKEDVDNTDLDGDSFLSSDGDCDDNNPSINPSAADLVGDGIDQNCDGIDGQDADGDGLASIHSGGIDCDDQDSETGAPTVVYMDADGDGYGAIHNALEECTVPNGFVTEVGDCNDLDPTAYPSANEICDEVDNNCDGQIDEDVLNTFYIDADGDGFGNPDYTTQDCEVPVGYSALGTDCDDGNPLANESTTAETCDGVDNNCDGQVDEGLTSSWYADTDGDGYGDSSSILVACEAPQGYVTDNTDCDDDNAWAYDISMAETCDGYDNNCDGQADEGVTTTYYLDVDGDGQGNSSLTIESCTQPAGYASVAGDCDDLNNAVHYQAIEICDEIDNNCDGLIDDGLGSYYYADSDGDGYGDSNVSVQACEAPQGYVTDNTDCDDNNAWAFDTNATETCDGVDNNCDGQADEGATTTYYLDIDGDNHGNPLLSIEDCQQPLGYSTTGDDCNDFDGTVSPSETETCDEIDNNCDGQIDEALTTTYYLDIDGDGYGNSSYSIDACSSPSGYTSDGTDCDDLNASISPAAVEICDEIDNDCDNDIDDTDGNVDVTTGWVFYIDSDGDGYGVNSSTTQACAVPSGYSSMDSDCDDGESTIYPNAPEIDDDGIDQDCDGQDTITTLFGNLDISSDTDATTFCQDYKSIMGTLTLKGTWSDGLALSCLESVNGSLLIQIDSPIDIELPNLTSVGGHLHITGPQTLFSSTEVASITSLSLPVLTNVGQDIQAIDLLSFDAPLLNTVGGNITIENFTELNLDGLQSASSVSLVCDTSSISDTGDTGQVGSGFDGETLCTTLDGAGGSYSILDCEDDLCESTGSTGDTGDTGSTGSTYSYAVDIDPLMTAHSCNACHSASLANGGFELSYDNLINQSSTVTGMPYVTPGDTASSYWYLKMGTDTSLYSGGQMPPGGISDSSELQLIADWINDGAAP